MNPSFSFAQTGKEDGLSGADFDAEALEALDKSIYINTISKTAHIDREQALSYYEFTSEELDAVQNDLDHLTEEEVTQIIHHSMANGDDGVQLRSASVIIWVGVSIILAIVASTAIYFSSTYMTHKEKQNLIDGCYEVGGTPIIDSGDTGELGGEPEKAWWKISNTYTFKCAI